MFLLAEGRVDSAGKLHETFLEAFFTEDFDEKARLNKKSVRAPTRQKIRTFLEAVEKKIHQGQLPDGHGLGTPMGGMYRVGSGFMHGRAASIMYLYDPESGRMLMNGIENNEYLKDELGSFWMAVLSAIMCFGGVSGRVWGEKYRDAVFEIAKEFSDVAGLQVNPYGVQIG